MKTNTNSSAVLNSEGKASFLSWGRFRSQCQEMRSLWKAKGFKALIKKYGWKFFAIVFFYYLIRDLTLYIVIPYLAAKHMGFN